MLDPHLRTHLVKETTRDTVFITAGTSGTLVLKPDVLNWEKESVHAVSSEHHS